MRASVVTPAFNAARTIERAVRSAVAQGPDVEVIVCDDGSTDDTAAIAERAGGVVLRLPHGGQSRARNAGIERASAPFLVFLDADDELVPGAIERMLAAFEPDVGVVCGRVEVRGEAEPRWWPPKTVAKPELTVDDFVRSNHIALGSAAIRTDLAKEIGGFDPSLDHTMDYNLWVRAAARARVRFVDEVFAFVDRGRPSVSSDRYGALTERLVMLERLVPEVVPRDRVIPTMARTAEELSRAARSRLERWRWRSRARRWKREADTLGSGRG